MGILILFITSLMFTHNVEQNSIIKNTIQVADTIIK